MRDFLNLRFVRYLIGNKFLIKEHAFCNIQSTRWIVKCVQCLVKYAHCLLQCEYCQLDGPILYFWSFGHFVLLKINLSIWTVGASKSDKGFDFSIFLFILFYNEAVHIWNIFQHLLLRIRTFIFKTIDINIFLSAYLLQEKSWYLNAKKYPSQKILSLISIS